MRRSTLHHRPLLRRPVSPGVHPTRCSPRSSRRADGGSREPRLFRFCSHLLRSAPRPRREPRLHVSLDRCPRSCRRNPRQLGPRSSSTGLRTSLTVSGGDALEWVRPAVGGILLGGLLRASPSSMGVGYPVIDRAEPPVASACPVLLIPLRGQRGGRRPPRTPFPPSPRCRARGRTRPPTPRSRASGWQRPLCPPSG